jgi:hypothetical protein
MPFVVIGTALGSLYLIERAAAYLRKAKIDDRRAKADYPITENDPVGRLIA